MSLLGMRTVLARIAATQVLSEKLAESAERKAAEAIAEKARSLAPINSGELRSSIVVETAGDETGVRARAPHARFQEFGTVHVAPRHFLQDAAEASTGSILGAFTKVFQTLTRR